MIEKTEKTVVNESMSASKKERFEFKLTVNGNIICQRYFRINNFNKFAYGSTEIVSAIDKCVDMINNDLKSKTQVFYEMTAPQVLDSVDDLESWVKGHEYYLEEPMYFVFRNSDDVYVYKDKELKPYTGIFNKIDYVNNEDDVIKADFKFAFLDNGVEIVSKGWDGLVYPKFIRTNVDLSNSKNRYKQDNVFAPIEYFMTSYFIKNYNDLIPVIVKELCEVCSYEHDNDYTTSVIYGDTNYELVYGKRIRKYIKDWENAVRKKTAEYFKRG